MPSLITVSKEGPSLALYQSAPFFWFFSIYLSQFEIMYLLNVYLPHKNYSLWEQKQVYCYLLQYAKPVAHTVLNIY